MSVDLARRYSDAVQARDYGTAESLLDPELEVVPPSGRPYGLAELRSAWAGPGFDHLEVALEQRDFEADGDEVVMRGKQVFRWKEHAEVAYVRSLETRYSFREGKIVRMEMSSE
ncbi:MAG: nuclear transport factor 2 family protein [Gaiellaceae bacterium]